VPDVLGQPSGLTFKGQNVQEYVSTLEDETTRLSLNVRHELPSDTVPRPRRMET
jgi:hypothetical protein